MQSLPDISGLCHLQQDEALAEVREVLTSVVVSGGKNPFAWLIAERPSFTARAAIEQALFTLDAELVRPQAAARNPFPPPMGVYFDIAPEDDHFPSGRDALEREHFPFTRAEIFRALTILWRYRRIVADQQSTHDEWHDLRSGLVRLGPDIDPEAWLLNAHPHAAAVFALDYALSICTGGIAGSSLNG